MDDKIRLYLEAYGWENLPTHGWVKVSSGGAVTAKEGSAEWEQDLEDAKAHATDGPMGAPR